MIVVNLLPVHLRPVKRTPIPYMVSGLIVLLTIVFMASICWSARRALAEQEDVLEDYKAQLAEFGDVAEEFEELQEQKEQLKERIDIINDIVRDRIVWSIQLARLSKLLPENFWLSGLKVEEQTVRRTTYVFNKKKDKKVQKQITEKRRVLVVSGYAKPDEEGNRSVYPLIYATQSDPVFSEMFTVLPLKKVSSDSVFNGQPVTEFTIEYEIKTREKDKGEDEKEDEA